MSWHAKCSLPVAVRVLKTRVLKLPIVDKMGLNFGEEDFAKTLFRAPTIPPATRARFL